MTSQTSDRHTLAVDTTIASVALHKAAGGTDDDRVQFVRNAVNRTLTDRGHAPLSNDEFRDVCAEALQTALRDNKAKGNA